jgi:hypothetical protein
MPVEYTECVKSYIKKGISEKIAKARCAGAYYKKHGMTVKEAHDKGIASFPVNMIDYDEDAMWDIMSRGDYELKPSKVILSGKIDKIEGNIVTIISAADGAKATLVPTDDVVYWRDKLLDKIAGTWKGGRVTINHDDGDYGKIVYSHYEKPSLFHVTRIDDERLLKRIPYAEGVSIEATNIKIDEKMDIVEGQGTNTSFIFFPQMPMCGPDEGCPILGSDNGNKKEEISSKDDGENMTENEKETIYLKDHNEILANKDNEIVSLQDKLKGFETLQEELKSLKEFKTEAEKNERTQLTDKLSKFGIDTANFKDINMESLRLQASTADTIYAKIEADKITDSGAQDTTVTGGESTEEKKLEKELEETKKAENKLLGGRVPKKEIPKKE